MKCSFCGKTIPKGRGKMLVKNDGRAFHFCGSKCQKNHSLGRDGKRTAWTKTFAEHRKK
jgi:large subunit ribosomal protein L24e